MKITRKKADTTIQSLIDEAAVLDLTIKEAEKKLKPLKEQINKHIEAGHSKTELQDGVSETIPGLNSYLKFVSCESREDADPEKVFKEMDKIGKADRFFDIIKVSVKDAAEILGAEIVKSFRPLKAKPYLIRLSFSEKG